MIQLFPILMIFYIVTGIFIRVWLFLLLCTNENCWHIFFVFCFFSGMCYVCPKCGKRYMRHSTLNRHLKYSCSEKKLDNKFHCTKCPKSFARNDVLLTHMRQVHDMAKTELLRLRWKKRTSN